MRGGFSGRRGMSPLIATVLLMAFAVALGGMIMNWSIDVSVSNECDDIQVDVTEFCTTDDGITLRGRSQPSSISLQGLILLVSTESVEQEVNVKNSAVEAGGSFGLNIPFQPGEGAVVDILGVIGSEANPYVCEEPIARVDPIGQC